MTKEQVITRLNEANEVGIKYFSITGGEPTLEEETLFAAIEEGERIGVRFNYLNTNCYNWGQSIEIAKEKLSKIAYLKRDTWNLDNTVICISVGDEHNGIPILRVANFIEAYVEIFSNTTIEAIGLRFKKKDETIEKLICELKRRNLLRKISNNVTRDFEDNERVKKIYLIKNVKISIFYNYVVPINRASNVNKDEYEIFNLTEEYLRKPLSRVPTSKGFFQAIIIGWDNKAAPDIVFKCTDTLVIQDSDKKTLAQIIEDGNKDPLLRVAVQSVGIIVYAAQKCGYSNVINDLIEKHSTIHGLISELICDNKRKNDIKNYIINQNY